MSKYIKSLEEDGRPQLLQLALLVVFTLMILVLFIFWRKRKSAGNTILLMGLSDSGKTLIYTRIFYAKILSCAKLCQTYRSMKENIGTITVNNRSLKLVDIPGDERLRNKYFDKYKSSVKGLVYVIDSVTIQKEIKDVAEYLYNLLSDSDIKNVPVLILCNKQDQTMAKGCAVIKTLLEKEINVLRITKTSQLQATDASSTNVFLGKQEKHFEFSHLDLQLDFAESYALAKDPQTVNIEELDKWLHKIA
ncbi:signal recognition particle receptor subunit beta [Monomorium pharaonis]|uniref:signal recognition particle receptor subunit beta n=1 Tax=Monomorium pharaonis TaxID=307658 RepID=UPI00063EE0EE|nr:signal recognition particle receptor subunit beta [Monomorium pharaonis]